MADSQVTTERAEGEPKRSADEHSWAVTLPLGVTAEMVADRRAALAVAQLDAVRAVLGAFDWERDDRRYALEEIERIVGRTYTHPGVLAFGVAQGWAEAETDP